MAGAGPDDHVTALTLQLFIRHRQGEITDAHWLEEYETSRFGAGLAHGRTWQAKRNALNPVVRWRVPLLLMSSFKLWVIGLALFGVAAVAILVSSVVVSRLRRR